MKYLLIALCLLFIQTNYAQSSSSEQQQQSADDSTDAPEMTSAEMTTTEMTTTDMTTTDMTTTDMTTTEMTNTEMTTTEVTDTDMTTTEEMTTTDMTTTEMTTTEMTTTEVLPVFVCDGTLLAPDSSDEDEAECREESFAVEGFSALDCQDDRSCKDSTIDITVEANSAFTLTCAGLATCRDSTITIDCSENGASVAAVECIGDKSCKGTTIEFIGCDVASIDCDDFQGCRDADLVFSSGSSLDDLSCENEIACTGCTASGDVTGTCSTLAGTPALLNDEQASDSSLQAANTSVVRNSLISVVVIIAVLAVVVAGVIYSRRRQRNGSAKLPMEDATELADMKHSAELGEDEENLIE